MSKLRHAGRALAPRVKRSARRAVEIGVRGLGTVPLTRSPKVSVVVPVYNVEPYLAACLRSISHQTYLNIEIVVVDDGSTDGSLAVAQRARRRDRRIRIVRQTNGGLSAARNTGIAAATGEYLAFVDSDDRIAWRTIATVMKSLRTTGSDFAVMSYRRMNSERTWPAGEWIREVHAEPRPGVTLSEFPEVLVNAVAWSKVYRRAFWDAAGLRFQVGVLYEDQAVSAEAYAKASAFDVLPDVLYDWRVREDKSSISQQVATENDLRERLGAATASLQALREYSTEDVLRARSRQLLVNDFRLSLAQISVAGDEYWKILVEGVRQLFELAPDDVWPDIFAQARALYHLVLVDDRAHAEAFLAQDGLAIDSFPTEVRDGRVHSLLPLHDDPDIEWPAGWNELGESQTLLRTAVRAGRWSTAGVLELQGWAYVANVDLAEHDTTVALVLRRQGGDDEVRLSVGPWTHPDLARVPKQHWCDYSRGGWSASVDVAELAALADGQPSTWQLHARVETAGVVREAPVVGVNRWGSAGQLPAQDLPDGTRVSQRIDASEHFVLHTHRPQVVLDSARSAGSELTVQLRVTAGAPVEGVSLRRAHQMVQARTVPAGDGLVSATLHLPRGTRRPRYWTVRASGSDGRERPVGFGGAVPTVTTGGGVQLRRTAAGNVTAVQNGTVVDVTDWRIEGDRLVVAGSTTTDERLELCWRATGREVLGTVERDGRSFTARLPLTEDPWGRGPAALPVGRYALVTRTVDPDGRTWPVALEPADTAIARFPLQVVTPGLRGRLERSPQGVVTLIVEPPLAADEVGARNQRRLRQLHRDDELTPRPDAVLFRSFYGENTSDGLAVHRELQRRGSDLSLYWVVRDHSVRVPSGGIPVVANSREHYELMGSARYVFDNVHQPDWAHKRPGQVYVQTFHGYPFKLMGHPYWEKSGYARHRVESFDRRMRDWDYVVSPAGYATPLLRDAFRIEGEMLEIGYPRNDVLVDEHAAATRRRTREALGLRDSQRVMLYAPTYRDNLSTSEFKSRMVDFLDVEQFSTAVGPDTVLLVRGHAMNARMNTRTERRGNVIDVTDHPEISDLVLASDAAILDYSSLRFDYAVTGKPMIFLVPDLDVYKDKARGWLFDYEPTAPGPLVSTTAEVLSVLARLPKTTARYELARERFRLEYMELEDGHAAARLVDAVMGPRGDA